MNAREIRRERKRLDERLAAIRRDKKILAAEIDALKEMCKHPKAYDTSHTGERCRDCPDCGSCVI